MSDSESTSSTSTPYSSAAPVKKTPVLSILSLVFGILGFIGAFFFGAGLLAAIAAIVLGFLGRSRDANAKGFWLTGIILGFAAIVIGIITIIVGIAAAVAFSGSSS